MKIYFAFTVTGNRSKLEDTKKLVSLLEEKGHFILTKHLFSNDPFEIDSKLRPEQVFLRDMEWLQSSDIVIIEATGSSFGIGFEAGYALGALNKTVYLLYDRTQENRISRMITGLLHENCTKIAYDNFNEVLKFFEKEL